MYARVTLSPDADSGRQFERAAASETTGWPCNTHSMPHMFIAAHDASFIFAMFSAPAGVRRKRIHEHEETEKRRVAEDQTVPMPT